MKSLNNYKSKLIKGSVLLFLITMFLFPYASFQGASSGLLLWFNTVLPSLLPFIIISNLMIRLNITKYISKVFYPLFHKIFHVSPDGCYPILIGFLSGIPMGAKTTADLLTERKISETEGRFLLTMCNNASPMFIMSYIAITQLKLPRIKYPLFAILYSSAIISALLYRFLWLKISSKRLTVQNIVSTNKLITKDSGKPVRFRFELVDSCILNGFEVVTKIGGYIILFSILAQIVYTIGPNISYVKAVLMSLFEITFGINQICSINIDINLKIVLVAVITSFGGLSGIAQTKSVLGETRLSMKSYVIAKLINALVTFIITILYVTLFPYT